MHSSRHLASCGLPYSVIYPGACTSYSFYLRIPGRGFTIAVSYPASWAEPSSVRVAKQQAAGRQQISDTACRDTRRSETRRVVGGVPEADCPTNEPLPDWINWCSSTCEWGACVFKQGLFSLEGLCLLW